MLIRFTIDRIDRELERNPALVLLGARQVGKTTLARSLAKVYNAIYLDLETPEDLLRLGDPSAFFQQNGDRLIVLDEIQRHPDIFRVLRGVIDRNRQQGRSNRQFLLLGSASMKLMRQTSESLAGRIALIEMSGLNLMETTRAPQAIGNPQTLWLRGGFPEAYLSEDNETAMLWLENLIRTYLERDVPQLGFRVPAARLRRLWTMLAHLQGEPPNHSKLGATQAVAGKTVGHYIDILDDLLLLRRLPPWYANTKKRLVKSSRCYIRDSGILHRLLGIGSVDALLANPILGKSWEGFVIENIHSLLPPLAETCFYRTDAGAEIDLVIRMPNSEVWAVEIKYGTTPKLSRHYSRTCEDVSATRKYIVYGGEDEFSLGDVTVLPLARLLEEVLLAGGGAEPGGADGFREERAAFAPRRIWPGLGEG